MPCYARATEYQKKAAIKRLEKQLKQHTAKLTKFGNRFQIRGWRGDRAGFCDDCAAEKLRQSTDINIRQMVSVAQKQGGQVGQTF